MRNGLLNREFDLDATRDDLSPCDDGLGLLSQGTEHQRMRL